MIDAAGEARVHQLIACGDHKAALEHAKAIHKASPTAASEALLVDAYVERIRSLVRRNLALEARSLLDLVRERYPSARTRLAGLLADVEACPGSLDELVRPLNNPDLDRAERDRIERAIQRSAWDLAALAHCEALPADHSLRQAASALDRAFAAVTTGPVADDALALPEVSHRSPLAPWKLLVRAIAGFHAGDDAGCRQYLGGIDPDSVPARLVPALQRMLEGVNGSTGAPGLTPAAAALTARITGDSTVRSALTELDEAFAAGHKSRVLKAIREAVSECRKCSPGQLDSLRQHISVRCAVADIDRSKVAAAMGGPSRKDATFYQLFARAMEETRDPEKLVVACSLWEEFRHVAEQEGWFPANGAEAAALALHVADKLGNLPDDLLRELQQSAKRQAGQTGRNVSYLFPEELYQRACALDPHPEAFAQWMEWAERQSPKQAERVAEAWHRICPRDSEPIVRLMKAAESRNDFHSALGYLARLERLDGLHPGAGRARFRLRAASALQYLQRKKPARAGDDLVALADLPEAKQGDSAALLAALRFAAAAGLRHTDAADRLRADVERLLESRTAAAMLLWTIATAAKQPAPPLGSVKALPKAERRVLPVVLARVASLVAELRITPQIPAAWIVEAARQFPGTRHILATDQLCTLGHLALMAGCGDFAYAVSAEGLERGGTTEARFLLLRARSVTEPLTRRVACAKAAAELARRQQDDTTVVDEAVELVRGLFQFEQASLTFDQARDVLRAEKAQSTPPGRTRRGPDYRHLVPLRPVVDPFVDLDGDDEEEEDDWDVPFPPDMPPDMAELFAEEIMKSMRRGESVEAFMARMLAGALPGRRSRKRRRR